MSLNVITNLDDTICFANELSGTLIVLQKERSEIKPVNCRKRSNSGLLGRLTSLLGFTPHQGFYEVRTNRILYSQDLEGWG